VKLSKLGEFELIDRLNKIIGKPAREAVLGIGDDAAAIKIRNSNIEILNKFQIRNSNCQLVTTDTLIQGVHFKLKGTSFAHLGYKALAINISDIAAMGGIPTYALITIGANKNFPVKKIEELYKGITNLAKKYKIGIIGGDTVSSPKELIISITLLGEADKKQMLTRAGAEVGDSILVTGNFGGPKADKFTICPSSPVPRIKESQIIAKSGFCTSMIDSSDGLVRSLFEVCKSSNVGARLFSDCVPIAHKANLKQALYGGEEYELVFTIKKGREAEMISLLSRRVETKVSICGEVVGEDDGIMLVDMLGKVRPFKSKGYEHFK
jgi:thiamine-monophosphate kinase